MYIHAVDLQLKIFVGAGYIAMHATLASRDVVIYLFYHPVSFDLSLDIHSAVESSKYVNYVHPTIFPR